MGARSTSPGPSRLRPKKEEEGSVTEDEADFYEPMDRILEGTPKTRMMTSPGPRISPFPS